MKERANKEHNERSRLPAISFINRRNIDMPNTPPMNGHIPRAPECIRIVGIPPVAIKVSIREMHQLAHQIQE